MSWPSLTIEIDFTHGPLTAIASATWVDVTAYVISFSTKRGRSDELGRMESGTASVVLDNSDRRFDPNFPSGPYYGSILPMRKIRISAVYSAVTYRLYVGHIVAWPPDWPGGLDATTTIQCEDAFKYFASKKLNGAYANEFCNWSIDTWLTNIGWPAADREFYGASSQIQAGTFVNVVALQHFQNAADVENGIFFMGGDGNAIFHNRNFRFTQSVSITRQGLFGDGHAQNPVVAGELPWLATTKVFDDTNIWNEARITRTGGVEQVASDATSQAAYFTRTLTKNLPILTDGEALSLAQYLISRYKDPRFRFTTITLDGLMDDNLWPQMLGRKVADRIRIIESPPGSPYRIVQDCFVEGISHDVADDHWRTVLSVSPTSGFTFWILDDTVLSILDSTTVLGY